jgi:hypothetical protein
MHRATNAAHANSAQQCTNWSCTARVRPPQDGSVYVGMGGTRMNSRLALGRLRWSWQNAAVPCCEVRFTHNKAVDRARLAPWTTLQTVQHFGWKEDTGFRAEVCVHLTLLRRRGAPLHPGSPPRLIVSVQHRGDHLWYHINVSRVTDTHSQPTNDNYAGLGTLPGSSPALDGWLLAWWMAAASSWTEAGPQSSAESSRTGAGTR